jgi:hypothetical protein
MNAGDDDGDEGGGGIAGDKDAKLTSLERCEKRLRWGAEAFLGCKV